MSYLPYELQPQDWGHTSTNHPSVGVDLTLHWLGRSTQQWGETYRAAYLRCLRRIAWMVVWDGVTALPNSRALTNLLLALGLAWWMLWGG